MTPESPALRSLRVLELIQANPGVTAGALADRLGVTDRAVRRHVSTLRQAGLFVDSAPGPGGGYRVARGTRMPLIFSQQELVALTMALSEVPEAVTDGQARSAVAKVLGALPGRVAGPAQAVLDAATSLPDASAVRPSAAIVLDLVRAIDEERVVEMTYWSAGHHEGGARLVEPWALLVRHRRWYLLGRNREGDSERTYRVDRIQAETLSERRFERPAGLDPAHEFEAHLRTRWAYPTHVEIHAPLAAVQPWIPFTMGELAPLGSDRCRLPGRTNNCTGYVIDLARTPYAYTVIDGDELRAAAQDVRQRITVSPRSTNVSGLVGQPPPHPLLESTHHIGGASDAEVLQRRSSQA